MTTSHTPSIDVFQQIWQKQAFKEEACAADAWPGESENTVKVLTLGSQFFYLHDCRMLALTYCSPGFQHLTGYKHLPNLEFLYDIIHPDDREAVIRYTWLAIDFSISQKGLRPLQDVFSVDYRLRQASGNYIRVQRQDAVWQKDPHDNILQTISLFTDITEHKKSHEVQYAFNHPAFGDYLLRNKEILQVATLTQREKQILHLLVKGRNSREIAQMLNISTFTVDTHRKNMKQKLKAKSTARLLLYALEQGLE